MCNDELYKSSLSIYFSRNLNKMVEIVKQVKRVDIYFKIAKNEICVAFICILVCFIELYFRFLI